MQAERKVLAAGEATNARLRDDIVSAAGELRHLSDQQDGQQDSRLRLATQRARSHRVDAAGSLAATNTGGLVAVDGYSPAIASLLSVSRSGFDPGEAMDSSTATTVDLLASAQEAAAKERDLIRALAIRGQLDPAVYGQVSELAAAQDIQASQAVASADPSLTARIDRAADAVAAASLGRDRLFLGGIDTASTDGASTDGASTDGASTDGTSAGVADVDAWLADATTRVAAFHDLRGDAAAIAVNAIDGLAASSRTLALASFASLLAAALISAFLVRSAIRSIARPLQELAHQAEDVALVRLPEAVKGQQSGSGDGRLPTIRAAGATEVREVAGAFNDVQDTALRLAGEQAVLRRNLAEALDEPRSAEPGAPRSPARLHLVAGAAGDGPRLPRAPLQARSPREPHATQRRVPPHPDRVRDASSPSQARSAERGRPGGDERGRGLREGPSGTPGRRDPHRAGRDRPRPHAGGADRELAPLLAARHDRRDRRTIARPGRLPAGRASTTAWAWPTSRSWRRTSASLASTRSTGCRPATSAST
ncbi:MAG: nitrate- and nitrite sensing domain-containing protein [Microthrixaceae bacterium]